MVLESYAIAQINLGLAVNPACASQMLGLQVDMTPHPNLQ